MKTFQISFASENKSRVVAKEWIGEGLVVELAPLKVKKSKMLEISLVPWAYMYNLVAVVLRRLDVLEETGQIVQQFHGE